MAGNDLRIKIVGTLNTGATIGEINTALKGIEKKINKLKLKVEVDQLKDITKAFSNIQNQTSKQGKGVKVVDESNLKTSKEIFTNVEAAVENFKKLGQVKISKIFDPATQELKSFNLEIQKADGLIEKLKFQTTKSQGVNGVDGFILTNKQELDKRSLETQKALSKTLQERQKEERKLAEEQAKAINKNIELTQKEKQKSAEKTKDLEHQLQLLRQQAQLNAQNLQRTHGGFVDNNAIKSYLSSVNSLTTTTPNLNKEMQNLNMQFRQISTNAKSAAGAAQHAGMSFKEMLSTAMTKFPINDSGGSKTSLIAGTPLEPFKLQRKDEIYLSVNV